jgi:hypothetical protein
VRYIAHVRQLVRVLALVGAVATASNPLPANGPIFREDDPLAREPETQDATGAREWEIDLFVDLAINLFGQPGDRATGVRAGNVNTIDEIPDSNWFTNRILARPLSIEEAVRGPQSGSHPAEGPWTVVAAKDVGFSPGFTMQDSAREMWFVSFDARGYPEAATGALLVANKIFWALGYWQVDNVLIRVRPGQLVLGETATVRPVSGQRRRMDARDLDAIFQRAHRSPDGSFRAVAARRLEGRPLGGFRYYGTRPDDANDIVPHEHRRELRALKVFGAWTNLVDMKAGNTLDVVVTENGRGIVRHYLQDVGSTFGTGALAPREFDEGWEHLYEGDLLWKRLASLGFFIRPWQTVPYEERLAIGRFEGKTFDPVTWKPRVPTAALRHAQPDDLFWAARRVMAFSNDMIRALVKTAGYTDPEAERLLADVLIERRDKIGAAYLTAVTPLVDFSLSTDGRLSFNNAAMSAGIAGARPAGYRVAWARFDNSTRATEAIGERTVAPDEPAYAPAPLPDEPGTFVCIRVDIVGRPAPAPAPVRAYFRRTADAWTLVGLQRGSARSERHETMFDGVAHELGR